MSQAEELLNGLSEQDIAAYTVSPETEEHIVIGSDRFIKVPDMLKRIAVQYDHNIETVTFDCPRYWDGIDMSGMKIYINYRLPNGKLGSYIAYNVIVDEVDESMMHFDWTISGDVTIVNGKLEFLVCIKTTDEDGNESTHWNTELNEEMYISEGLECEGSVVTENPAIITELLTRMDGVDSKISGTVPLNTIKYTETATGFDITISGSTNNFLVEKDASGRIIRITNQTLNYVAWEGEYLE